MKKILLLFICFELVSGLRLCAQTPLYSTASGDNFLLHYPGTMNRCEKGQSITFMADHTITAATPPTTITINGLTAQTIHNSAGNNLTAGDIRANQEVTLVYDGTEFQMISTSGNAVGGVANAAGYLANNGSGTLSWLSPGAIVNSVSASAPLSSNGGSNPTISISGVIPILSGGTGGQNLPTAGAVAYGTGTQYGFTGVGSVGSFLSSNGAGAPTWQNVPGTLSGGTINYLPKWSTSNSLSSSSLIYDTGTNAGIGTSSPDASAIMDISSASNGILIPRIMQAQRNAISNPATSLLIYQTDNTSGYYYNAGTPSTPNWVQLATGAVTSVSSLGNVHTTNLSNPPTVLKTSLALAANSNYILFFSCDFQGESGCAGCGLYQFDDGTTVFSAGGTEMGGGYQPYSNIVPYSTGAGGATVYIHFSDGNGGGAGVDMKNARITAVNNGVTTAGTINSVSASAPLSSSGGSNPTISLSGALPIANGGTNNAGLAVTAGGIIFADGTKLVNSGAGSSGQVLTSTGAGAPSWQAAGTGTVTSFSSGSAAPLFTTSVTTPTTTPALSFSLTSASANTILGNNTFSAATPTYFSPTLASGLFQNQGTTTTVLHGNAAGNPSWTQISLTTDVINTLPVSNGGTGLIAYTIGDIPYASAAGTLSKLSDVAAGNALISGGIGVAPSWGKIGLTTHVNGTLPIANGGTNSAAALAGSSIMVSNGGSIVQGGSGTTTTVLHGNVAGVPVYGAVTLTTDVAGTLPIANGGTNNPALAVTLGGVIIGNGVQLINTGPGVVGNVLKSNGAAAPTWGPAPINDYAIYEEQEPSGTSGGTSVFSAWTQRVLNTTVSSSGASISRAGNVITLVAGTYKVLAYGMAFNPTNYYLRLQNTSLASTALLGITEYGATGGTGADYSSKAIIEGVITVAATNTFDIEYFINFSQANGLGIGGNSGITNVFSHIHIERIQ